MTTTVTAARAMTLRKNSTTKMAANTLAARPASGVPSTRMLSPAAALAAISTASRGSR